MEKSQTSGLLNQCRRLSWEPGCTLIVLSSCDYHVEIYQVCADILSEEQKEILYHHPSFEEVMYKRVSFVGNHRYEEIHHAYTLPNTLTMMEREAKAPNYSHCMVDGHVRSGLRQSGPMLILLRQFCNGDGSIKFIPLRIIVTMF